MRLGKPVVCGECNHKSLVLEVEDDKVFSVCLNCGFKEWEWMFGDDPEYLKKLAEKHGIPYKKLWNAVKKELPTEIQKTIINQLFTLDPLFMSIYNIKEIMVKEDGRTVRLHHKGRLVINIDITYNEGTDLYEVKAYMIKNIRDFNQEPFYQLNEVYYPDLIDVIDAIFSKAYGKP